MGHPDVLGKEMPGHYVDTILADGNRLEDFSIPQDTKNLHAIVVNGYLHKNSEKAAFIPRGATHLPTRVVLEGELVIPVRMKGKRRQPKVDVEAGLNSQATNGTNGHMKSDIKGVGFFKVGVAEDDGPVEGSSG